MRSDPCARSGGNRRKVELARAMRLHRPRLLLMDEATVGPIRSRAASSPRPSSTCRQHGVAAPLTTHLVDDEVAQADRVLVLHRGRCASDGDIPACLALTGAADLEAAFLQLTGQAA